MDDLVERLEHEQLEALLEMVPDWVEKIQDRYLKLELCLRIGRALGQIADMHEEALDIFSYALQIVDNEMVDGA